MELSNGATGTIYAVEEVSKPLELAKAAKIGFRVSPAFYLGCTSAKARNLKSATPLGIFRGLLSDGTPAVPCKSLIEKAEAAGANAEIHLFANAYYSFDVPRLNERVCNDARMKANPQLAKSVHVGGIDEARAAAIKDVALFVERIFKINVAQPTAKPKRQIIDLN